MRNGFVFAAIAAVLVSCGAHDGKKVEKIKAEVLFKNATIYTVDSNFSKAQAMAISGDSILAVGSLAELRKTCTFTDSIDLNGKFVYPGFIDGHCHFLGYGRTLFDVDLVGTKSRKDVLQKVNDFFGENPTSWVKGRGWDQNDWPNQNFPTKESLDSLYPNTPVALRRIDGHALWVNSKALELAKITAKTEVEGGDVLLNREGEPRGILVDAAMDAVLNIIPENIKELDEEAIAKAQKNCLAVGLTSVHDAGLPLQDVLFMQEQAEAGKLKLRVYQMISNTPETIEHFEKNGFYEHPNLNMRSIKCYMDGALGSRGALLKQPYFDEPGNKGLQLISDSAMQALAKRAYSMNFQLNTHAIGDMGVHKVLEAYKLALPKENDRRWRVEHSQVVDPVDIFTYKNYQILPSVQATHATSDMRWAPERLSARVKVAYAYKDLLEMNHMIINGSDFPVEGIDPIKGFYAAVFRKDSEGFPENGFQMDNALSREEAIRAMTIWAAYGEFAENEKGSLEAGKLADFVVLDRDIMKIPENYILNTQILHTFIGGREVYRNDNAK